MTLNIPLKLLISLLLGAVIGLERESYQKEVQKNHNEGLGSLGVRSFSLISAIGTIAGLVYYDFFSIFLITSITFMTLLIAYSAI